MTLREVVKGYREAHSLSQRQFATNCHLSNGYISMVEKNMNPKTGLPVTPSIPALKKIAAGMGMTLNDLFLLVDDTTINIPTASGGKRKKTPTPDNGDGRNSEAMHLYDSLPETQRQEAVKYLRYLAANVNKQ